MSARIRIGELLVSAGLLSRAQLEQALEQQRSQGAGGRRLGQLLVEMGFVTELQLTKVLSQQLSIPWVSLQHIDFSRALLALVPAELAEEFCVLPVYVRHERKAGDTLYLAMDDPTHDEALRRVTAVCNMPVKAMIAPPSDLREAIRSSYGTQEAAPAPVVAPAPRRARAVPPPPPPPRRATGETAIPQTPPQAPPQSATQTPVESPAETPAPAVATVVAPAAPSEEKPQPAATAPSPAPSPAPEVRKERVSLRRSRRRSSVVPPSPEAPGNSVDAARKMVALTLLDGTTIQVPSQRGRTAAEYDSPRAHDDEMPSALELLEALRAVARGADPKETLGDTSWEELFAALLAVLLRKQLLSGREFVEAWKKITQAPRPPTKDG